MTVIPTTLDGKEKWNMHHTNPITSVDALTNAFDQFQDSVRNNPWSAAPHQYNLRSKINLL